MSQGWRKLCYHGMQVREIALKKFSSRAPLGSLKKQQEVKLRSLPTIRARILKSGPAPDVAEREAVLQAKEKAQKEAKALVQAAGKKRKRTNHEGPHRVGVKER